jgi:hypothetical protein
MYKNLFFEIHVRNSWISIFNPFGFFNFEIYHENLRKFPEIAQPAQGCPFVANACCSSPPQCRSFYDAQLSLSMLRTAPSSHFAKACTVVCVIPQCLVASACPEMPPRQTPRHC